VVPREIVAGLSSEAEAVSCQKAIDIEETCMKGLRVVKGISQWQPAPPLEGYESRRPSRLCRCGLGLALVSEKS
jgi:hypothetical protein